MICDELTGAIPIMNKVKPRKKTRSPYEETARLILRNVESMLRDGAKTSVEQVLQLQDVESLRQFDRHILRPAQTDIFRAGSLHVLDPTEYPKPRRKTLFDLAYFHLFCIRSIPYNHFDVIFNFILFDPERFYAYDWTLRHYTNNFLWARAPERKRRFLSKKTKPQKMYRPHDGKTVVKPAGLNLQETFTVSDPRYPIAVDEHGDIHLKELFLLGQEPETLQSTRFTPVKDADFPECSETVKLAFSTANVTSIWQQIAAARKSGSSPSPPPSSGLREFHYLGGERALLGGGDEGGVLPRHTAAHVRLLLSALRCGWFDDDSDHARSDINPRPMLAAHSPAAAEPYKPFTSRGFLWFALEKSHCLWEV